MRRSSTATLLGLLIACLSVNRAIAATVAKTGDASISRDDRTGTWTVSAGRAALTLRASAAADFAVLLTSPSGRAWTIDSSPDTSLTVNGHVLAFGSASAGFTFQGTGLVTDGPRLRFDVTYSLLPAGLRVTRHYAVADGSPTFEIWTTLERAGQNSVTVANLEAIELTVPPGRIHWLNGLQGDSADVMHDAAFTLQSRSLSPGEHLRKGSQHRSSEQTVPWFVVDGPTDEFYTALLWSGAWSFTATGSADGLAITFGLGAMTTIVDAEPIDGPHAIVGAVEGDIRNASAAVRSYIFTSIRQGRPFAPLVTYNTWYAFGTSIDEGGVHGAMLRAAALGIELFVIDAGWYTGAGTHGRWDFATGLGTWQPDPARFPDGLSPLRDYAHSLGMKFGIWVEPPRVSLDTVGQPGLAQEPWLATRRGQYGSGDSALICLAGRAGREWVLAELTELIETVQPDYLKWDNNLSVSCDRDGHGHGPHDGNFAQVNGLYAVLSTIRATYPNVLIESAGGGGTQLDLGILRYVDRAWMDDRTAPATVVRHNTEGLSTLFPPASLLSFVIDAAAEPIHGTSDLSLAFRSRMIGGLGLSFRNEGFSGDELSAMQREIALENRTRAVRSDAAGAMLTPQAKVTNGPSWDAFQETAADQQRVLIWAFQTDPAVRTFTVMPTGLMPTAQYEVWSADVGAIGSASGAELAASGIEIPSSSVSAAHLLILTVQP
jgi:alpha-galactosidase